MLIQEMKFDRCYVNGNETVSSIMWTSLRCMQFDWSAFTYRLIITDVKNEKIVYIDDEACTDDEIQFRGAFEA